jgi:formylglycine-generating enzyme
VLPSSRHGAAFAGALLALAAIPSCSASRAPAPTEAPAPRAAAPAAPAQGDAGLQPAAPPAAPPAPAPAPACPEGMAHVEKDFCTEVTRRCLEPKYDPANRITICHRFAEGSTACVGPRKTLDFCIDVYEFPNEPGGHPPVMVDWHDAQAKCEERGKRLCTENEWTAACEGPDELPFPYGWKRSAEACNIDNRWISPSLTKVYSKKPDVRDAELRRLDQSVPSGSKPGCVSGYGVYDLTGNFDEWTRADPERPNKPGKYAALKGGAWGHVRNACRPVTTSHEPAFTYYFVSFRCCRDASVRFGAATD